MAGDAAAAQLSLFGPATASSAVISECGRYRYELIRRWGTGSRLA